SHSQLIFTGDPLIITNVKCITHTQDLSKDDEITLAMKDGNVDAIVKKVRCEHE
ncbi:exodeoxyribonuclease VII large subunit, partial [Staphylococcus haemolyticus]|nr:exodeoxyribonuclease VII large subunit [Staphylococcus haemolyticus]